MNQSTQDKVALEVYGIPYNNLTYHYKKQIAPVIEAEMAKGLNELGVCDRCETHELCAASGCSFEIGMARTGGINSVDQTKI